MSYWEINDTDDQRQQLLANTYGTLERTGASIQRSHQAALETEQMGAEVLSELGGQRETLLRTNRRLEDADEDLSQSQRIIRKLRREVIYNKILLILIIILELGILVGMLVIKYAIKH